MKGFISRGFLTTATDIDIYHIRTFSVKMRKKELGKHMKLLLFDVAGPSVPHRYINTYHSGYARTEPAYAVTVVSS